MSTPNSTFVPAATSFARLPFDAARYSGVRVASRAERAQSAALRGSLLGGLSVALAVLAVWPEIFPSRPALGALGWIALSVLSLLLAPLRPRRVPVFFPDPLWLLATLYLLYFPARLAFLRYGSAYTMTALDAWASIELHGVRSLRLVTLAGCAVYWGTCIRWPSAERLRFLAPLWSRPATDQHVISWLILGCFGAGWRIATYSSMRVWEFSHHSSIGAVFVYLMECGIVATAAAFTFARDRTLRILAVLLFACNAVAMIGYAFKEPIIMFALFLIAGRSYREKQLPWRKVAVAGVLLVFVVFPVVQSLRVAAYRGEEASWNDVSGYVRFRFTGAENSGPAEIVLSILGRISERLHGVESLSTVLDRVPETIPHTGLPSILSRVAWTLAPRFLMPEKPRIHQGPMFNRDFVGIQSDTPIAIFQVAEAYYVAGLPFLAAIGVLQGWFGGLLCRLRWIFRSECFFPYLCILLWTLVAVERDIVLTWTTLPRMMLVFACLSWVLRAFFPSGQKARRLPMQPTGERSHTSPQGLVR